jgi:hypothetical protein
MFGFGLVGAMTGFGLNGNNLPVLRNRQAIGEIT